MRRTATRSSTRFARWRRRRQRTVKVTSEGKFFITLTIVLGIITVNTGLNLLYLLLALLLSVIMVSGFLSEMSLRGITVRRRLPAEIWAGRPVGITLDLRNTKRWLPSFSLHIADRLQPSRGAVQRTSHYILYLRPQEHRRVTSTLTVERRGRYEIQGPYLSTRFPFGLFLKTQRVPQDADLLVYPKLVPVRSTAFGGVLDDGQSRQARSASPLRQRRSSAREFHALHEFRPGDNPKWIHWRSSARQDQLMVKEFEPSREQCVKLLLDPTCEPDMPDAAAAFERAVGVAAFLSCELQARGWSVLFATIADELHLIPNGAGRSHLRRILRLLATVPGRVDVDLETLYRAVRRRGGRQALTLVVGSATVANGKAAPELQGRGVLLQPLHTWAAGRPMQGVASRRRTQLLHGERLSRGEGWT